jgi:hypothetical protein
MPVDPSALVEAVIDGLSKIPSGIFAALLLGGPTVVWLILRFANPRDARSRYGSVSADLHWICPECRSLNEDRNARCYRCFLMRADAVLPLLAAAGAADPAGVGIAVGPGLPAGAQATNWLDEDVVEELEPADDEFAPADVPEPVAEPVPVLAAAVATPEVAPIFEPLVLEPRVKAARRTSSSRSTRRR